MASIIEKYASEDVTLLQGPVISDGKTTFENSISAKAIVSDFSQADLDYFGRIEAGRIFYVSPLDAPPTLPGQIIWNGITHDIKGVRSPVYPVEDKKKHHCGNDKSACFFKKT